MTPFLQQLVARGCITATQDTPLQNIAETMTKARIGTVVICDDHEIIGILSERDIIRTIAKHGSISEMKAGDIMTRDVFFIPPTVNSTTIMDIMSARKIRHIPIVEDGKLRGIVSITDVVRRLSEKTKEEADLLREFINS